MMRAILMASVVLLGGCSLGLGGKAPPFLLTLSPDAVAEADQGRQVKPGEAIVVAAPIVPQAIATNRVPVADGRTAIAYVKDAAWVEPPARLFQRLVAETLRAKTGRVVLDPRQLPASPGVLLSGQLLHFGIDARRNEAVVIYDAALAHGRSQTIATRRFEARAPVSVIDATNSGAALGKAANTVAAQVADWVAASKAS
jgi:cholesterol transport system auxiliary component